VLNFSPLKNGITYKKGIW